MKRPPAAESVTLTLSAWELRVLRAYAAQPGMSREGRSWQELAQSLLSDAIEGAAGELVVNGLPCPPGPALLRDEPLSEAVLAELAEVERRIG